jgi:ubiquinone/menaquinone biosynthesis C-methylase UbiE
MLPRVLEPEVMDTPEEARDYDAMDHSAVNERFVQDFLQAHGPCGGGWILDVGTGTARIPMALCRVDPSAKVLAIDLSRHMLDLAERNVRQAGFADRIRLRCVDAKELDLAEPFEAVISNSIVHHIPEPRDVLEAMLRRVAPGGTLYVRDLARPASREELENLVATYAGKESSHARQMFADSLHAALTLEEVRGLVRSLGLPGEGVRVTSDRHWTWSWHRR